MSHRKWQECSFRVHLTNRNSRVMVYTHANTKWWKRGWKCSTPCSVIAPGTPQIHVGFPPPFLLQPCGGCTFAIYRSEICWNPIKRIKMPTLCLSSLKVENSAGSLKAHCYATLCSMKRVSSKTDWGLKRIIGKFSYRVYISVRKAESLHCFIIFVFFPLLTS